MGSVRKTITLSEHLGVTAARLQKLGILNTNLGIDMKLFIDPKLVRSTKVPELIDATRSVRAYFDKLLKVNAQIPNSERLYEIALSMIAVHEPIGLAIGYGDSRDTGTSISRSVAEASLRSLNEMLRVGISDITVMEMLGLFISNFGSDSVSDLIAHIVYDDLCAYTARIAKENGFATTKFTINGNDYHLPKHPFKGTQIIFVPLDVLSHLPLATTWPEIASAARHNARVRMDFNALVGKSIERFAKEVKKNPINVITSAKKMRTIIQAYIEAKPKPYDVNVDPLGYLRLNAYSDEISGTLEVVDVDIKTIVEVQSVIMGKVLPQYKRQIEQLGANKLLYRRIGTTLQKVDTDSPVHEEAAQVLFHIIADQICNDSNVMLSREPTTAPGAVDFSLGKGYKDKVVVEIKKSNNKNLIDGYTKQVVAYEEAEAASSSVYVVVIVSQKSVDDPDSQFNRLKLMHAHKIENGERTPDLFIIDGRVYDSASKR